jgi:hypothetical protein
LAVSAAATIRPVSASTPMCSLRHDLRRLVPCFSTSLPLAGLMTSVLALMGLMLSAPDHTTISRRSVTLPVI